MRRAGCFPLDHHNIGRRDLIRVGGLSLLGMGLADLLRLEAQASPENGNPAKAKAVIFIFQSGGPSQHETFDPKPLAPEGIRGEYGTTATRQSGAYFCEYLPKLAQRSNKFSVVRTMHHIADRQFRNEHNSCNYFVNTGTTELPIGDTNASIALPRRGRMAWPTIGSMVAYSAPADPQVGLPSTIEIPRASHMRYAGRSSGILGPAYEKFGVDLAPNCSAEGGSCPNCFRHADPNLDPERLPGGSRAWWDNSSCRKADFHLPDLGIEQGISVEQLNHRSDLLKHLDHLRRSVEASHRYPIEVAWDSYRRQALQFILAAKPGRQSPFDLTVETQSTRQLYGDQEWGNAFLVARRLIEAGVRMVQVNLRGWDTHQNAFRDLKGRLLPAIDHCLSGLLDDLDDRGLLESTLIFMCGEMGRTPTISPITVGGKNVAGEVFTPGRHHWGDVFPCFVAGGGIQPGRIIGTSDRHGGLPTSDAYTPADLAATIFHLLGIGHEREFHDADGRPYRIFRGVPIAELL